MKRYVILYVSTAIVLFPLDMLWLAVVARSFYRSRLGELLLAAPNYGAAIAFYVVYVAGIVVFAGAPAAAAGSWRTALIYGGLFGFFAYATYDLTNLAALKSWPVTVGAVDLLWGTILSGISAALGVVIAGLLSPKL